MKFGIALPHSGPLASVENIIRVASVVDSLGYESIWVHDHITYDTDWLGHRTSGIVDENGQQDPNFYESLITLAYVAGITERVKLGTAILVLPLRDPRVLARQMISLQELSDGRLMVGVGTGDYPSDFRVMGIPYEERVSYTEEYLDALSVILPGGRMSYQGNIVTIDNASFFPEVDTIPLLMGGGIRRRAGSQDHELFEPPLRRIARWCHGWIPEGPPEMVAAGVKTIMNLAQDYNRGDTDFDIRPASVLYLGDAEEARRIVDRHLDYELVGPIEKVSNIITSYQSAGANALNLRCWADDMSSLVTMLKTFARQIMPQFS